MSSDGRRPAAVGVRMSWMNEAAASEDWSLGNWHLIGRELGLSKNIVADIVNRNRSPAQASR
jgi:hypothetical protein